MNFFPLYSDLNVDLVDKDLTVAQKNNFIKKIQIIDTDGMERLYTLIRFFHQENNENFLSSNFYNCSICDNKITFDLEVFPFKLKQLLYKFILLHLKK